ALPTNRVRTRLGANLLRQKRYAEAEPLLLKAYAVRSQGALAEDGKPSAPEVSRDRAATRRLLAQLYDRWGKPEEAARWQAPPANQPPPGDKGDPRRQGKQDAKSP